MIVLLGTRLGVVRLMVALYVLGMNILLRASYR